MPKQDTDDAAKKVVKRFKLSQDYTQPYFDRFLDDYKHYFLRVIDEAVEQDASSYPFYSQLMLPISYQIVETILPRMLAKLFTFSIKTEEQNDEMDEQALAELIRYQINHPYLIDNPVFLRLVNFAKECFIAGNAVGIVPWVKKAAKVREFQPYSRLMGSQPSWDNLPKIQGMGIKPDWKQIEVEKVLIDAPVFDYRSIFHFFPDPKKTSISSMGYGIFEEMMTMDEIMEMVKLSSSDYKNIDELKKMKAMKEYGSKGQHNYDEDMAQIFNSQDYSTKDETEGMYHVLEMRELDKLTVVINKKLTIRESGNPNRDGKLGVIFMKDIPVPGQFYGWGEIDPIKKIEDTMSDMGNMRVDNVIRSMLRMWMVNPNGLVDGEEFIPEPDTVVQVTDMNAIKPIDVQDVTASSYKELDAWQQVIQNVSGVSDYATGQSGPDINPTKGGVEMLQQAANARFSFKLQLFENLALKSIGTMYVSRNMQFFDSPQSVSTEKGKMVITPEQIRRLRGNVQFMVDAGSSEAVNRQTELAKWQDILDRIGEGKPPFINLTPEAMDKAAKSYLTALKVTNPDEIIKHNPMPIPGTVNPEGGINGIPGEGQAVLPEDLSAPIPGPSPENNPALASAQEFVGAAGLQGA